MREDYVTPEFKIHTHILYGTVICALYSVVPVWALLLCAKPLRLSFRAHAIQLAVYAGWLGTHRPVLRPRSLAILHLAGRLTQKAERFRPAFR